MVQVQHHHQRRQADEERQRHVQQHLARHHHRERGERHGNARDGAGPSPVQASRHDSHDDRGGQPQDNRHQARGKIVDAGEPIDQRDHELPEQRVGTEHCEQVRVSLVAGEGGGLARVHGLVRVEAVAVQVPEAPDRAGRHQDA